MNLHPYSDYRTSSAYLRSNRKRVGEDRPVWPLTPADLPVSYGGKQ